MASFHGKSFQGVLISANSKTGHSINVSLAECEPTPWCKINCYSRFRTTEEDLPRSNSSPIAQPSKQRRYAMTAVAIRELYKVGKLGKVAQQAAQWVLSRGYSDLRVCGCGDLFEELTKMVVCFEGSGIHTFGFSKKPRELIRMANLADQARLPRRPFFSGSMDHTTEPKQAEDLLEATLALNGFPSVVYVVDNPGWVGYKEVEEHPLREYITVVFGFHTSYNKTVINHALECPATAGKRVKCDECKRCIDGQVASN